jgi:hypothetical protein
VGSNYFTYYSGHRPRYPLPCDVIEWPAAPDLPNGSGQAALASVTAGRHTDQLRHPEQPAQAAGAADLPELVAWEHVTLETPVFAPRRVRGMESRIVRLRQGRGNVLSGAGSGMGRNPL